ncbi:hypothetical protein Scuro_40 [Acinetobacter phage Scuro]|nr:hypothetical protein Scuro_40 [Acinetobacter phage Scuro]
MKSLLIITCLLLLLHLATIIRGFAHMALYQGFDALFFAYTLFWVLWTIVLAMQAEFILTKIGTILRLADIGAVRFMKGKR